MKEHAFRLKNGQDLIEEIDKYVQEYQIRAGVIVSCVGNLSSAILRKPEGKDLGRYKEKLEIVSVTGTVSIRGCNINISALNKEGITRGGQVKSGCLVNHTAEVVLLELENHSFYREWDFNTGHTELKVNKF